MIIEIIKTELFCVAAACFFWGLQGYSYIDWRKAE